MRPFPFFPGTPGHGRHMPDSLLNHKHIAYSTVEIRNWIWRYLSYLLISTRRALISLTPAQPFFLHSTPEPTNSNPFSIHNRGQDKKILSLAVVHLYLLPTKTIPFPLPILVECTLPLWHKEHGSEHSYATLSSAYIVYLYTICYYYLH